MATPDYVFYLTNVTFTDLTKKAEEAEAESEAAGGSTEKVTAEATVASKESADVKTGYPDILDRYLEIIAKNGDIM